MIDERNERLIGLAQEAVRKIAEPKCSKCQHTPLEFTCNVARTHEGHIVSAIWCIHCGHILNIQFLGTEPPQIAQVHKIIRPA